MHTLAPIVAQLVEALLAAGDLELEPGATATQVADHVTAQLVVAPDFARLSHWLGTQLINCPHVAELYIDDREILERLTALWV